MKLSKCKDLDNPNKQCIIKDHLLEVNFMVADFETCYTFNRSTFWNYQWHIRHSCTIYFYYTN